MLDALLTNKRKNPTNMTVPLERVLSWMPNYTSMHTHINGFNAVLKEETQLMYGEMNWKIASKFVKLDLFSMHSIDKITGITNEI